MKAEELYHRFPYPVVPLDRRPTPEELAYWDARASYQWAWGAVPGEVPARHILVAGCGTGWDAAQVAMANPESEVAACDLSAASIEIARKRAARLGLENLRCFMHDLTQPLPATEGPFEFIVANGVLHHLPNPAEGLRHLVAAADDGRFLLHATLYGRAGRAQITRARALLRAMNIERLPPEEQPAFARRVLEALPPGHPVRAGALDTPLGRGYYESDAHLADTFLVEFDHTYDLEGVEALLAEAGLPLLRLVDEPHWRLPAECAELREIAADQAVAEPWRREARLVELLYPERAGGYIFLAGRPDESFRSSGARLCPNPWFLAAVEAAEKRGDRALTGWPWAIEPEEETSLAPGGPWRRALEALGENNAAGLSGDPAAATEDLAARNLLYKLVSPRPPS